MNIDVCTPLLNVAFQSAMKGLRKDVAKFFKGMDNPIIDQIAAENLDTTMKFLQEHMMDFVSQKDGVLPPTEIAKIFKKMINRTTIDLINDYKSTRNLIDRYDRIVKNATTEKELHNGISSLFQKTYNAMEHKARQFGSVVDNVFDTLATGGTRVNSENIHRARIMFFDSIANEDGGMLRKHLIQKYNVKEDDVNKTIFYALKDGSSKIPELDIIARAVKKIDETVVGLTKKDAPYFNSIDEYVVSTRTSRDKLYKEGEANLAEFIMQKADVEHFVGKKNPTKDEMLDAVRKYYNSQTKGTDFGARQLYQSPKKILGHRKIHFKDAEAEWEFLQRFGATDKNFLYGAMNHKRSLMTKTSLYNQHGANLEFNASVLAEHINAKGLITDPKRTSQVIKEQSDFVRNLSYSSSVTDQAINDSYGAIQSFTSASLTGKAVVRDVVYDQTVYSGLQASLIKETSAVKEWMKSTWKLATTALQGGRMDELKSILEAQGFAIDISSHHQYQGIAESLTKHNKQSKTARAFDSIGAAVSKYTGADRILRSSKVNQHIQASNILFRHFSGEMKMTTALRSYLEEAGLGKSEISILNKVRRLQHNGKDIILDANDILNLPDEAVSKIILKGENARDAKIRLQFAYKDILTEMANDLSSRTTLRGRLFTKTGNATIDSTLGLTTKFSNIALSQLYNQQRLMLRAAGRNPNYIGHTHAWDLKSPIMDVYTAAKGNPMAVGKWFAGATAAGMMSLWIKDITSNNTPREITPEAIAEGLQLTGAGGAVGMLLNNMYYNDDVLATPAASAIVKPAWKVGQGVLKSVQEGDPEYAKRAAAKAAKKLPFMDTWYTKAGVDVLFRKGLNVEMTAYERRKLEENNQEKLIE